MDFEGHKLTIKLEKIWEVKYMKFVGKEISLTQEQKETILKRINERRDKIEDELNKNIEDNYEEDEKE